jgi:hypothetical protein
MNRHCNRTLRILAALVAVLLFARAGSGPPHPLPQPKSGTGSPPGKLYFCRARTVPSYLLIGRAFSI